MRVLLTLHHGLTSDSGAPGVTLAIGRALAAQGCAVAYYSYDDAYGTRAPSLRDALEFPWRAAAHLARRAGAYDVVDASSGDAWVWAALGRPGAGAGAGLVTRSHGLEHTVDRALRADVAAGRSRVRRRYYFYHGGYRLWEVARSLRLADHAIVLNALDLAFVRERLHVPAARSTIVPHGVSETLFASDLRPSPGGAIRLAFIGSWIERKGTATVVEMMTALVARGVAADLLVLGTGATAETVLAAFPAEVRARVVVRPRFENARLPELLDDRQALVFASRAEGFGLAILEGMACGLAPLATPVGAAATVIADGVNGRLLPVGDGGAFADAAAALARDPARLDAMRAAARATAARARWSDVARATIAVYEAARASRAR